MKRASAALMSALSFTVVVALTVVPTAAEAATWPGTQAYRNCGSASQSACLVFENETIGFSGPGVASLHDGLSLLQASKTEIAGKGIEIGGGDPTSSLSPGNWESVSCLDAQEGLLSGCALSGSWNVKQSGELAGSYGAVAGKPVSVAFSAENISRYMGSCLAGSCIRDSRKNFVRHECQASKFISCSLVKEDTATEGHVWVYKLADHLVDVTLKNETSQEFAVGGGCENDLPDPSSRNTTAIPPIVAPNHGYSAGYALPTSGEMSCRIRVDFVNGGALNSSLNLHEVIMSIRGQVHGQTVKYSHVCDAYVITPNPITFDPATKHRFIAKKPVCSQTDHLHMHGLALDNVVITIKP